MGVHRWSLWTRMAIVTLALLRLVYISHDEIRSFPYDDTAYIMQAREWYWGNEYNTWTYTRQPGYPLFLALGSMLGVPARLMIEAVWIGAGLVVARMLRHAGVRPSGCVMAFGLLLFHPMATALFTRALADNLYTAAWLVYTAALAVATGARASRTMLRWGMVAGLAGAVAANTRQEAVLVYALALGAGLVAFVGRRALADVAQPMARRLAAAAALPIAITLAAQQGVHAANQAKIGTWVGYDWALPGFKALYRTMLSVPPEEPRLRVPIPADVRARAGQASPMFAALREEMENGASCADYRRDGERITGIPGEPGSYNLWTMREAIWTIHRGEIKNAGDYDAVCWRIVGELRAAQDQGTLAKRWAPMSFIPPEWDQLAVEVPRSLGACWRKMSGVGFDRKAPALGPQITQGYNEVAMRRHALVREQYPPRRAAARDYDESEAGKAARERGPWHRASNIARMDSIKRGIDAAWVWVSGALVAAWLGGWLAAFLSQRRGRTLNGAWLAAAAMVTISLLARTALVMTLEATGVPASHRYMFPSAALLVVAGVLGIRMMAVFVGRQQPL